MTAMHPLQNLAHGRSDAHGAAQFHNVEPARVLLAASASEFIFRFTTWACDPSSPLGEPSDNVDTLVTNCETVVLDRAYEPLCLQGALRGIKLRDCTSFGLPQHWRLSVQPPAAQDALVHAMKELA